MDEQVPAVVAGPLALPLSIHPYPPPPVQHRGGEHSALCPRQAGSLVLKRARGMLGAKDVAQTHCCGEREEHANHEVMMLFKHCDTTEKDKQAEQEKIRPCGRLYPLTTGRDRGGRRCIVWKR